MRPSQGFRIFWRFRDLGFHGFRALSYSRGVGFSVQGFEGYRMLDAEVGVDELGV